MNGSQNKSSSAQSKTRAPKQKQPPSSSAAMIALASTNAAATPVWIEGDDNGTVISEITSDQTAPYGDDSLISILGCFSQTIGGVVSPDHPSKRASVKMGDNGSHTDQPTSTKTLSSGSSTIQAGAKKTASPKAAPSKSTAKAAPSKSTASSTKVASQKASPKDGDSKVTAKKKAPHPAMDVSPNLQILKAKSHDSDGPTITPSPAVTTTATTPVWNSSQTKHAPKTPPAVTPAFLKLPAPTPPSASGAGLSELSKQLRVQRAKNDWQHNEIARLERQLRILSDLKGVSVADLRHSLESACAEEAHGELRNQVMSLQAQLEALQMQRSKPRRASTADEEAAQSKIATLQLRIGELEEVDQARHQEVQALYRQLQEQMARATTLEATNTHQQAHLNRFEQVAQAYMRDVTQIQAERDALKEQVAELQQLLANQDNQRKLEEAMAAIEASIEAEQARKREYMNHARQQMTANRSVAPTSVATNSVAASYVVPPPSSRQYRTAGPAVNNRLSPNQLANIQGIVGRQAGVLPAANAPTIAIRVRDENNTTLNVSSTNSSVATGPNEMDDDVSRLDDDTDNMSNMSVHTMDALMLQGLSEEQAKEALAKDAKISSLYGELREQATKTSQLQTLCANQKAQIERFADELNEKEGILRSTQSTYDFAKSEHDSLYQRFCDIELQLTLEHEKVEGLERHLQARIHEGNLRNDQYRCRFQVQNERIADLEQQQSSLYTAFELLQQEVKEQDREQNKLKSSLDEADSEVARQLREAEKSNRRSSRRRSSGVERPSLSASQRNLLDSSTTSIGGHDSLTFGGPPVATATPIASQAQAFASFNQSIHEDEDATLQQGIDHPGPVCAYGYLWKLDKIKGWKKRFFVLYGEGRMYHMTYSDSPKERVKGTIYNITMGVSTVAETNKSVKKPFSFVLHVDPSQQNTQVLYAAALTANDFRKWMSALQAATILPGDSCYMSQRNLLSAEAQIEADMEIARQLHDSQIEADHLIATRLQMENEPGRAFT